MYTRKYISHIILYTIIGFLYTEIVLIGELLTTLTTLYI
jgi:hypothetical protein